MAAKRIRLSGRSGTVVSGQHAVCRLDDGTVVAATAYPGTLRSRGCSGGLCHGSDLLYSPRTVLARRATQSPFVE